MGFAAFPPKNRYLENVWGSGSRSQLAAAVAYERVCGFSSQSARRVDGGRSARKAFCRTIGDRRSAISPSFAAAASRIWCSVRIATIFTRISPA
jgi:hypothetical protein